MSPVKYRIFKGSAWAFIGKVIMTVFGMLINIMLARLLEPDELGVYFLVLSLGSVAVLIGQVGQNQIVVRYIASQMALNQQGQIKDIILKAIVLTVIASCMISVFFYLFTVSIAPELFHSMLVLVGVFFMIGWIVLTATRSLIAECMRGFQDISRATFHEGVLASGVFLIFVSFLWIDGGTTQLKDVLFYMFISAVIAFIGAVFSLRMKIRSFPFDESIRWSEMIHPALPLLVSNIVFLLLTQMGIWFVAYFGSPSDVALYGAAFRLIAVMQFPLLVLNAVIPPLIAEQLAQNKKEKLERVLRLAASSVFMIVFLVELVLIVFGTEILSVLFGEFYSGAYWVLISLGTGILVNSWAGFCGPVLIMAGKQGLLVNIALISAVVACMLAVLLGGSFGTEGIAVSMALGFALQHILMLVWVRKDVGVWTCPGGFTRFVWGYCMEVLK